MTNRRQRLLRRAGHGLRVIVLALLLGPVAVSAAVTHQVDSITDAGDAFPGDGTCATSGGVCTLRAALDEAAQSIATTMVVLPAGTYVLAGSLSVTRSVVIRGAGAGSTVIDLDSGVGFVVADTELRIEDLSIINGLADGDSGPAIQGRFADIELAGVTIDGNAADGDGGAIATVGGALSVTDSLFANNFGQSGGAIFAVLTEITITDSRFEDNGASQYGAALFASFPRGLSIMGSHFLRNTAILSGGAIYLEGYEGDPATIALTIVDTQFTENSSGQDGGALYVSTTSNGAAGLPLLLTGVDFVNNQAITGGAIAVDHGSLDIADSDFNGNSATGGPGGAIASGGALVVANVVFDANTAFGSGGAVAAGGPTRIDGSQFTNNSSESLGGGVSLFGDDEPEITNSSFVGNRGEVGAGAYWRLGEDPVTANLTVSDNEPIDDQVLVELPAVDQVPSVCGTAATLISAVQGTSAHPNWPDAAMRGADVTVEGIVTADFQGSGGLGGFFVQEEDADADTDVESSEGLFVYDPANRIGNVVVGDRVRVTGTVTEVDNNTQLSLGEGDICSRNHSLPTLATVTLPEVQDGDLEFVEGMRVQIETVAADSAMMVTQNTHLGRFGQLALVSPDDAGALTRLVEPTQPAAPGSAAALQRYAEYARRLLYLDDAFAGENPDPVPFLGPADSRIVLRGGDLVTALYGVLDQGQIDSGAAVGSSIDYRLQPLTEPEFTSANARTVAPDGVGGTLRVASFNLDHYFTTLDDGRDRCGPNQNLPCTGADSAEELARQQDKLVAAICALDADILGLIAIENTAGVAAEATLAAALNADTRCDPADTDPYTALPTGPLGTEAIKQAFVYNTDTVQPVGDPAVLDTPAFTDPNALGSQQNRPALAQAFEEIANGEQVIVVANHLQSKRASCGPGDDDLDIGAGGTQQGNCNLTRTLASEALRDWLTSDPTNTGEADLLIIGDLNAYAMEDPIQALTDPNAGGIALTDLIGERLGSSAYSVVVDGRVGYVDHALASDSLRLQVSGVTVWHIDSDEPAVLDYDLDGNPDGYFAADAYRAADHDPIVVGLGLSQAVDTVPPVVTPPADITTEATAVLTPVTLGVASTDDGSPVTNDAPAAGFPLGTTPVVWSATDAAGNVGDATQQVTIIDTTPPELTVPADIVTLSAGPLTSVDLGAASATDLFGPVEVANYAPPAGFPVGTTTVNWTATDANGNVASATQQVTVNDLSAPVVTPPPDIVTEALGVLTPVDLGNATTNDGSPVVNDAPADGFPLGSTTVIWTATDSSGNSGSASQIVTIVDTTPPVLTVPPSVVVEATGPLTPVTLGIATASDLFEPIVIANDAPAGGFPPGTTVVTWTATDANDNIATAVQSVTVEEQSTGGPRLTTGRIFDVGDAWQVVTLPLQYTDPVVVTTVQYDPGLPPAVSRVRNAGDNAFEVRVQNPSDEVLDGGYTVHYVVAEAGVYTEATHGISMEAVKVESSRTDGAVNGWVGEAGSYGNSYLQPVVLGQVMSANDDRWSVFWARGRTKRLPPSTAHLFTGKHVGEDPDADRVPETLGYLVFESGSGVLDGLFFDAGVSANIVQGVANKTAPYAVPHGLASISGAIASAATMRGLDGGWPILYGSAPFDGGKLDLAIAEDQVSDSETWHGVERVGYLVFDQVSGADGPGLMSGQLQDVGDTWQTVNLPMGYSAPVVVAAVAYDPGLPPAIARVRNADGDRFEVRVQNPSDEPLDGGYTLYYVVAEAGVYNEVEHGIRMEAVKVDAGSTDGRVNGWVGEAAAYANSYSHPVVVGQVMSANDPRWSVFWAHGRTKGAPPDSDNLYVGKHVGEDPNATRATETLGYLVVERGSGVLPNGLVYDAGVSAAVVKGTANQGAPFPVPHDLPMVSSGVVSSATMRGRDGGWPILYGSTHFDDGRIDLAIEEDQTRDTETAHGVERVAFLLVSQTSNVEGAGLMAGVQRDVGDTWRTVTLPMIYSDPVVVATVQYDASLSPAVARVRNVVGSSFDLRVQNPGGLPLDGGYTVQYVVAESGEYNEADHGIKMEAVKVESTVTDGKVNGWSGEAIGYANSYTSPVVVGQVITDNDPRWSVFWARGATPRLPPDADRLFVGKHVGEDPDGVRASETLGYLVLESGGGVLSNGLVFEAGVSEIVIKGVTNGPPFQVPHGLSDVTGGVVSSAAMRGGDGGWPILYGRTPFDTGQLDLAIQEDQIQDDETRHAREQAGYLLIR